MKKAIRGFAILAGLGLSVAPAWAQYSPVLFPAASPAQAPVLPETAPAEQAPVVEGAPATEAGPLVEGAPLFEGTPGPAQPSSGAASASTEPGCSGSCACACGPFDFSKVPPTRIFPRPGNFSIPPSGPGYYSAVDWLVGNCRKGPPKSAWPSFTLMGPGFFDADFRYLEAKDYKDHDLLDELHRRRVGCDFLFSTGGEAWYRYMNEVNSRLSGRNNDYHQERARVYADLWYRDLFRVYVEFIHANTYGNELAPLPIDVNKADLQNAFIDLKIADIDGAPAYVRIGRQELLLGSQRLISTLDWANTRRTFQGVRAFRQGEKFDVDLFWLQFVQPNSGQFDSVDNNQNFAGLWTTYRPRQGHFLDAYYLFLDNTNSRQQLGLDLAPFNVHTLGGRYVGDVENRWLYDVEGALQLGEHGNQSTVAGMATVGGGYHAKCLPWNPTAWVYYDWASGDSDPGQGGQYNTFNQLYPFGHYYLGWIDQVGRQNIHDVNLHLYLYPTKWVTFWAQYHHFTLANARDALYNAAGAPSRRDPTGAAGRDVGQEIDLIMSFHIGKRTDVMVGYSKLFGGSFLENTGSRRADAELLYFIYNVRW